MGYSSRYEKDYFWMMMRWFVSRQVDGIDSEGCRYVRVTRVAEGEVGRPATRDKRKGWSLRGYGGFDNR